jgi:hypothetical protein
MSSADAHVVDWLKLIRAEDLEIPSLSLTKEPVTLRWPLIVGRRWLFFLQGGGDAAMPKRPASFTAGGRKHDGSNNRRLRVGHTLS